MVTFVGRQLQTVWFTQNQVCTFPAAQASVNTVPFQSVLTGIPAVAQRVKNPATTARVPAEAWV